MSSPPPEQPYQLPGTEPAWEPSTLPEHAMTAADAAPLVPKIIGLGDLVKPSVGRIVHYVSHGTPRRPDGTQAFTSECRAAIVTEVAEDGKVGLMVANPTGLFLNRDVPHHDGTGQPGSPDCPNAAWHGSPHRYCACGWTEAACRGGTWHWPERAE